MESKKTFEEINEEIKKDILNGPTFATNSSFQIQNFIIAAHSNPARRYRQVLLELNQRRLALITAKNNRVKTQAKLNILNKKFELEKDDDERTLIDCDIQELMLSRDNEEKLILDATKEYCLMLDIYSNTPKFTAEEYDKQELDYWKKRLGTDAQLQVLERGSIESGTAKALHQIGVNPIHLQTQLKVFNNKESECALLECQKELAKLDKKD